MRQIQEKYGETGLVRLEFKQFAFLSQESVWAAEASLCADAQGQFWPYHDMLFANQGQYSQSNLKRYAKELGLNPVAFDNCLDSGEYSQEVQDQLAEGEARGVNSTPTLYINDIELVGVRTFEILEEIIEQELAK